MILADIMHPCNNAVQLFPVLEAEDLMHCILFFFCWFYYLL